MLWLPCNSYGALDANHWWEGDLATTWKVVCSWLGGCGVREVPLHLDSDVEPLVGQQVACNNPDITVWWQFVWCLRGNAEIEHVSKAVGLGGNA